MMADPGDPGDKVSEDNGQSDSRNETAESFPHLVPHATFRGVREVLLCYGEVLTN